jgi:hypothetical protein
MELRDIDVAELQGALTQQDVMRMLKTNKVTLWRWRQEGTGPACIQVGRKFLFPRARFEQWLASQKRGRWAVAPAQAVA